MSNKSPPIFIELMYQAHAVYFIYSEKDKCFVPLDENRLSKEISGYTSLNEKARKRKYDSFIKKARLFGRSSTPAGCRMYRKSRALNGCHQKKRLPLQRRSFPSVQCSSHPNLGIGFWPIFCAASTVPLYAERSRPFHQPSRFTAIRLRFCWPLSVW